MCADTLAALLPLVQGGCDGANGRAKALGARDALNLDGGGSTGMTLGQNLVTRPSDPTGERPIADAIFIRP